MRIGVGGLSCECCTFSPLISTKRDFLILKGAGLLSQYDFLSNYPEIDAVPLLWARAIPGGSIAREFYEETKAEFLSALRSAGDLDGLLLIMHGASNVVGMDDVEADFFSAIRGAVGSKCVIAASYDLHGNVSDGVMKHLDILTAYRTAPHRDVDETRARACLLLVRALSRGEAIFRTSVPIPILLPGERTSTDWEPGAGLYEGIPEVIKEFGLLDASILIGYAWADEPRSTACAVALGRDSDSVERAATKMARRLWEARFEFDFGSPTGSIDDCIGSAIESVERPVVISDSGDNPTAGGAGDVPFFLERLLAFKVPDAVYASVADPEAVAACVRAGVGEIAELSLGGKLDAVHGSPLAVRGEVLKIRETHLPPGTLGGDTNTIVVVKIDSVRVIITEKRTPFHRIEDFTRLGIYPNDHHILVVKIGYLEPELKDLAARSLIALSPGAVDQDIVRLPYKRIRRPMFPFDPEFDWQPSDVKVLCRS